MDRTTELIRKAHEGDQEARTRLVEENVGLVWCIVRRYSGRGTEAEDLFQIGSIGLLKAIDKFDLAYDVRFSTYAVPMISGEIRRFLRDDGMLKVSRSLKEISYKACQAKEEFVRKYNREPTIQELSELSGVGKEELVQELKKRGFRFVTKRKDKVEELWNLSDGINSPCEEVVQNIVEQIGVRRYKELCENALYLDLDDLKQLVEDVQGLIFQSL